MKLQKNSPIFILILLFIYLCEMFFLAINPTNRQVWFSENIWPWLVVVILMIMWVKGIRFSNIAYFLITFYLCWHTVGGHFTFEKVPFDWVTQLIGAERNHFDRVAHFAVGFFALPIIEFLWMKQMTTSKTLIIYIAIVSIIAVAGLFELVEWIYAEIMNPEAGVAFLGSQGDVWDAQKDILADTLGAIATSLGFLVFSKKSFSPQEIQKENIC